MSLIIATEAYVAYAMDGPVPIHRPWDRVNHYGHVRDNYAHPTLTVVGYGSIFDERADQIMDEIDHGIIVQYQPSLRPSDDDQGLVLDRRDGTPTIYVVKPGVLAKVSTDYVAIGPYSDFALGMLDQLTPSKEAIDRIFSEWYSRYCPTGKEYWISNHLTVIESGA